jgi:IS5 family transposase
MIDLRHPLAVLATRMPWTEIEKSLAPLFARKARMGNMKLEAPPRQNSCRADRTQQ